MNFSYQEFTSGSASELWEQVQNHLNSLNDVQSGSAKVAASDISGGQARAVVVNCNSSDKTPHFDPMSGWDFKSFTTDDEYKKLYQDCTDLLNELPPLIAYSARVCMNNAEGSDAKLTVFYRKKA